MSELVARHLRPYNLNIAHKPTESLRKTLVHVKDPLPTQRRRNVVYSIPCSECPSAYVGQTGRQFATHQSAVRRKDENSLLALHRLTTVHAFDWTRASVVGNGVTKRTREFIEAWKTTPTLFSTSKVTIQLATNAVVSRLFSAELTHIVVVRRLAGKKGHICTGYSTTMDNL